MRRCNRPGAAAGGRNRRSLPRIRHRSPSGPAPSRKGRRARTRRRGGHGSSPQLGRKCRPTPRRRSKGCAGRRPPPAGPARVLLCNSEGDLRLEREYIEDLVSHRVEGLLLAPASDRSRHSVFPLLRGGFPLVLIDRALPDSDCDLVVGDNVAGARRLVEHLIAVGHRDIAHLTDAEDTSTGRERLRGLSRGARRGRHRRIARTWSSGPPSTSIGGYRATQQVLGLEPSRPRSSRSTT